MCRTSSIAGRGTCGSPGVDAFLISALADSHQLLLRPIIRHVTAKWSWSPILAEREFWPLHFGAFEPFGVDQGSPRVRELAEALFFVETVKRIRPARDRASLDLVRDLGEGFSRTMILRQLAVAKLPRRHIRLLYPGGYAWRIEYGPQGSVAHYLESPALTDPLQIGCFSGHPSLPALRLAEWEAMLGAHIDADVPAHFVPLLLFAGVGAVDRALATKLLRKRALEALKILGIPDSAPLVDHVLPAARWRYTIKYGWITGFPSSYRNPSGDHAGASWRRLARKTKDPEHQRVADEMRAEAWKPHQEFRALREFFDTLGVGGPDGR
jgi:hypothetical protein